MTPMAPTRPNRQTSIASPPLPVVQHQYRTPLMADLAAAAVARSVVEDAIRAWRVPVDPDVAVLLTSELVTNAVKHGSPTAGTFVLLTIACDPSGDSRSPAARRGRASVRERRQAAAITGRGAVASAP